MEKTRIEVTAMAIAPGMTHTVAMTVTKEYTASMVGSGSVEVFATPMMIALMEAAAAACVQDSLEEGKTSVGTALNVSHLAATPPGMRVEATATVTEADGNRVEFSVTASDETGLIGEGTHTRFIVDRERFVQKALSKLK